MAFVVVNQHGHLGQQIEGDCPMDMAGALVDDVEKCGDGIGVPAIGLDDVSRMTMLSLRVS